jgi:hypothetical protein
MFCLRAALVSDLVAAMMLLLVACAPALDFDSLTSGNGSKGDASLDGPVEAQVDAQDDVLQPTDATSDSSSPADAGSDAPGDASSTDVVQEYAADPCADVDAANNGVYCGRTMQSGFSGGNPLDLYTCKGGMVVNLSICPNGCFIAPAGYEDECDDCSGNADGPYCGSQFGYVQPSDRLLIVCSAGHVSDGGITPCMTSCVLTGGAHCGP